MTVLDGSSLYVELLPLEKHRPFVDHLFILQDRGRFIRTGENLFASPFLEIAVVYQSDTDRVRVVASGPRFERTPRMRAFYGIMAGLRLPADQEVVVALDLAGLSDALASRMAGGELLDGIVQALDLWIETRCRAFLEKSRDSNEPDAALRRPLPALRAQTKIASLADDAGTSGRTLQRRFRARTGVAPKKLAMLNRFHSSVRAIVSDSSSLSVLALDMGFADQAHLTSDMVRHSGTSPARLRASAQEKLPPRNVRIFKDRILQERLKLVLRGKAAPPDTDET